ncbi:MAG: CsgG/HfaB family protein [Syntrophales bacterium]|jgi:curli biogenesis system outer membrane secretion channel CsgG
MNKRLILSVFVVLFISGCASAPKIDLTAFVPDREPKIRIPLACKSKYDAPLPFVAVTNFTNNTSFDYANIVQSQVQGSGQRTAVGGAAVGVAPGAAGVVWGTREHSSFQANSQSVSRQINAKLSESIEDGVLDEIVNMGGAKVYTRKEMDKIFSEQKFQQSGMVDDATMVQLGKLKGVKYIITGSVNNVDLKWVSYQSAKKDLGKGGSGNQWVDLAMVVGAAALEAQEGWNIGTEVTLRVLDVESGEVVLSKKMMGKHIIGKIPYPNYDALIGGIKKSTSKSLQSARPELSKYFPLKGYVTMIKNSPDGKEKAVRISVGEKVGIKPGNELFVYTFEEIEDPMSGKKECDVQRLPVSLIVSSDQLQPNVAWALADASKPEQMKMIRVGQLVERKPLK